jgi:hypothetical protein
VTELDHERVKGMSRPVSRPPSMTMMRDGDARPASHSEAVCTASTPAPNAPVSVSFYG